MRAPEEIIASVTTNAMETEDALKITSVQENLDDLHQHQHLY